MTKGLRSEEYYIDRVKVLSTQQKGRDLSGIVDIHSAYLLSFCLDFGRYAANFLTRVSKSWVTAGREDGERSGDGDGLGEVEEMQRHHDAIEAPH